MKFQIEREQLLGPLSTVVGVVERRQTLPILANVLLHLEDRTLTLTGTDLEVEISIETETLEGDNGQCTVTARKLLDICRALPETATVEFTSEANKARLRSSHSPTDHAESGKGARHVLSALPEQGASLRRAGRRDASLTPGAGSGGMEAGRPGREPLRFHRAVR